MCDIPAYLKEKIRKENKVESILLLLFFFLFMFQCMALVYFNTAQLKYHLGYDISSNYLRTIEMARQHTLLPDHWAYTTGRSVIGTPAIAALFYIILKDIYLAFGLANLSVSIVTMFVLWKLLSVIGCSYMARFAGLNFYLCPFITAEYNNTCDLGYASNMLLGAGFYSVVILVVLLCLLYLLTVKKTLRYAVYGIFLTVLLAVMAATSGLFVWSTFVAAGLLYYIVSAIWQKDISFLKCCQFRFFFINCVLGIAAKFTAGYVFHIKTHDSSLTFTLAGDLLDNMGDIFAGFVQFLGGLPYSERVSVMSRQGICYMMGWVLIAMLLLAAVWAVNSFHRERDQWRGLLLFILLENIGLFSVCNVTYGAEIFENRYLLVSLFALLCMLLSYLDNLKENPYMRTVFAGAFFTAVLVLDMSGDYKYLKTKNDYQYLEAVLDVLEDYHVPLVYGYGREVFDDVRNMRVLDPDKVYKTITKYNYYAPWGDYTYYQDNFDYNGENCLIATAEDFNGLPRFIKKDYSLLASIDKYNIYHSDISKFDLSSDLAQHTVDFPYSYGFETCNGRFDDEGRWVTNGAEGHCLYGPYCNTKQGVYDVILNYEILENGERPNAFDIAVGNGQQVLAAVELKDTEQSAEIRGLEIADGDVLEYRVFNAKDSIMRICSIEVICLQDGGDRSVADKEPETGMEEK